ncbi:MAG: Rpn family recombination-promoting nuclease/putative transposase [Paludibacteraceae bacterium]|nr:Rpn family recombination-promoting nuclease/putative transposase [Paludibacteraceae bacterium]
MDNLKKRPVFIDLRTDFGFKRCFGDEKVMKRFLNIIIGKEYGEIESLVFENVESTRVRECQRGVTFDLRCRLANGDEVIVEMQNYGHRFFQTRANYYLYNLMDKHIGKGTAWSERETDIPHLIGVFILGAPMDELKEVITQTAECDLSTKEIIWDRLRKYYISLPNFSFDVTNAKLSDEDIWIQTIKNIGKMERIDPKIYDRADDELKALIDKARISALSDEEYSRYEAELKVLSDEGTAERYGFDRGVKKGESIGLVKGKAIGLEEGKAIGLEKGRNEERQEIISNLLASGIAPQQIAEFTKIPLEEVLRVKNAND